MMVLDPSSLWCRTWIWAEEETLAWILVSLTWDHQPTIWALTVSHRQTTQAWRSLILICKLHQTDKIDLLQGAIMLATRKSQRMFAWRTTARNDNGQMHFTVCYICIQVIHYVHRLLGKWTWGINLESWHLTNLKTALITTTYAITLYEDDL